METRAAPRNEDVFGPVVIRRPMRERGTVR